MEESINGISLKEELASFGRYFDANSRCVLSAPFGEGKSYFLKEFIKEKSSEYDFITLYPTNYQVCDNKDVFEYIKRDILLALLALNPEILERYDKARAQIVWDSVMSCKGDVVSCLPDINIGISGISGTTISLSKILNVMCVILDKIHSDESCDGNPIKSYLDSIENQQGGIYEFNPTCNLIASLIGERKDNDRKVVLVIEDLDRIDPAHIFRILNVFSAHFSDDLDEEFTKNKFGFDKVMLLCDYDNIEKIYHHLYGLATDFKGYISKFSPKVVYTYSLRSKVCDYMLSLLPENLKSEYPSIINLIVNEIFTQSSKVCLKDENLRTLKYKFLNYKSLIIESDIYFWRYSAGAYIKSFNVDLVNLLALTKIFEIDLCSLLIEESGGGIGHELYKICWPYIILKDNKPAAIGDFGYVGDLKKCLNGHHPIVVEDYKENEIIKVRVNSQSDVFKEVYLKEVYSFIKGFECYIG